MCITAPLMRAYRRSTKHFGSLRSVVGRSQQQSLPGSAAADDAADAAEGAMTCVGSIQHGGRAEHQPEPHQRQGQHGAWPVQFQPQQLQQWQRQQHHQHHHQQQLPPFAAQLLQQLQSLHHHMRGCHSAATSQPQQQQQPKHCGHVQPQPDKHVSGISTSVLQPHQAAAVAAVTSQLSSQQRLLVRLPPSADINPVVTQLVAHYCTTHVVLVLASCSSRVLTLKATLQPLLKPAGITPRVVPGELLQPRDTVLLVDLHSLQQMPGASIQLLQQQAVQQGLAIYEEGFLGCGSSSSSSSGGGEVMRCSLFSDSLRATAQQLLRQLRFLEPNPGRLLVSLSSRGWQAMLLPQQWSAGALVQHSQYRSEPSSSSSSSSSTAECLLPGYELSMQQALAEGLVRPAAAASVPVPTGGGDTAALLAAADGVGAAATPQQQPHELAGMPAAHVWSSVDIANSLSVSRLGSLVAAAYKALGGGGKALAYTAGVMHARNLAIELHLQGISSLVLHGYQSPEDQAEVLEAFRDGPDKVLVTSLTGEAAAAAPLDCELSCVLMVTPTLSPELYAARLAPALLPAAARLGFGTHGSIGSAGRCVVVDFVDESVEGEGATASENTGVAAVSSVTCGDVLGPACSQLPLPAELAAVLASGSVAAAAPATVEATAAAAAAAAQVSNHSSAPKHVAASSAGQHSSSNNSTGASSSSGSSSSVQAVRGDLIWTILDNGSWAIPLKRGRGANMTGLLVLWLTKQTRGWVPEMETGLGQLSPLPGTSGKPLKLQRARLLAEAWVKAHHPVDAHLREAGMEWRDRAMSEAQIVFCERHCIPYDPSWSRGTVNNTIDRYVVETMRLPATERQMFLARHLSPYAPSYLVHSSSTALMYRQAADHLIQALLTGNFNKSSAQPSKAALKAEASAAVAAAAASGAQGSVDSVGRDQVLPARKALLDDLEAQYAAGLRPKCTWMIIRGQQLLLDLMSGSYLWLRPVEPAAAAAVARPAAAAGTEAAKGSSSTAGKEQRHCSSSSSNVRCRLTEEQDSGDSSSNSELGSDTVDLHAAEPFSPATAGAAAAASGLDPSALYELLLELPDGSLHQVANPSTVTALLTAYSTAHSVPSAAVPAGSSSRGAKPLPLPAALARAERLAALLATQRHAFLSREAAVRLAGMVGGWKVPSKASEQQMAMPASPRQLELLRAAGLPHSKRYSCLDAHRELLRHTKTHGLPEPPITPSQLARMQELHIPMSPEAARALTSAEAKALLFKVQLAEEQREAELAKQKGRAKGPIMGGVGRKPRRLKAT